MKRALEVLAKLLLGLIHITMWIVIILGLLSFVGVLIGYNEMMFIILAILLVITILFSLTLLFATLYKLGDNLYEFIKRRLIK